MDKRMKPIALAFVLAFGAAAAWAKLPPPPPVDEATKAAAAEKKAAADKKAKEDLEASQEKAIKNYHANMKKAGKPVPKATPVVAAAAKPAEKAPAKK